MPYRIIFSRAGVDHLPSSPWERDLDSAKAHASDYLPIYKERHEATSVRIIDDGTQAVLFSLESIPHAERICEEIAPPHLILHVFTSLYVLGQPGHYPNAWQDMIEAAARMVGPRCRWQNCKIHTADGSIFPVGPP